jgi:hypothetical protein
MKPGARLVLLEELIPDTPELVPGKWIDLLMLAITGGRERTEKEYCELLSAAGFGLEEVVPTAGPLTILIANVRARNLNQRGQHFQTDPFTGLLTSARLSPVRTRRSRGRRLRWYSA